MTPLDELKTYISRRNPTEIMVLVDGVTDHRTTHLEDLTGSEINLLITVLKPKTLEEKTSALVDEIVMKRWRSNILALAERTGIKKLGEFNDFNSWMIRSSLFKKQLNAHNMEELKLLYQQLRAVERNNERSASKPMTKVWWKKADSLKNHN